MRLRSTLGTALLAGLVSFAVTLGVHSHRNSVAAASDDPFAVLDLTPQQKGRIHEIAMKHHGDLLARQGAVDEARLRLASLLAAPGRFDDAALARSLSEVARLESELDLEVARNLIELRPLLTEAQQRTLFKHIQLRHSRNSRPVPGDTRP